MRPNNPWKNCECRFCSFWELAKRPVKLERCRWWCQSFWIPSRGYCPRSSRYTEVLQIPKSSDLSDPDRFSKRMSEEGIKPFQYKESWYPSNNSNSVLANIIDNIVKQSTDSSYKRHRIRSTHQEISIGKSSKFQIQIENWLMNQLIVYWRQTTIYSFH